METTSYRNIIIATDGSELAKKAVTQGVSLAKSLNVKLTFVMVSESWIPPETTIAIFREMDEYDKATAEHAASVLQAAADVAKEFGVVCQTVHVKDHHPADGIIEEANKRQCDLIVMSSHGRHAVERLLLGSQALKVLTYSKIPVLICR